MLLIMLLHCSSSAAVQETLIQTAEKPHVDNQAVLRSSGQSAPCLFVMSIPARLISFVYLSAQQLVSAQLSCSSTSTPAQAFGSSHPARALNRQSTQCTQSCI
jgi:hypothetical protein